MSRVGWDSRIPPSPPIKGKWDFARVLLRGIPLVVLITICLAVMMILRFFEWLIFKAERPWTSFFPRFVSRTALKLLGIKLTINGTPHSHAALVANHSSWLDIFVLNASARIFFVSKAEVANWPGIGILARATGTVFITRKRTEAAKQEQLFRKRLAAGHRLLFFPEGTSSDSLRVLPFKPTLFAAFFSPDLIDQSWVQPLTVHYTAPDGEDQRYYSWWGDMEFGASLIEILGQSPQGFVTVTFHAPIEVKNIKDRKALANLCEEKTRSALPDIPAKYRDA